MASRTGAIERARKYIDSGEFEADLARRVAIPTESQTPEGEAQRDDEKFSCAAAWEFQGVGEHRRAVAHVALEALDLRQAGGNGLDLGLPGVVGGKHARRVGRLERNILKIKLLDCKLLLLCALRLPLCCCGGIVSGVACTVSDKKRHG